VSKTKNRSSIRAAAILLGVGRGATIADVVAARRAHAKRWHPDVNPETGSVAQMRQINLACDLLCDHIRAGGFIEGVAAPRQGAPQGPRPTPPRAIEIQLDHRASPDMAGLAVQVAPPDRYVRLELDLGDALEGCTRSVRFVRREPRRCQWCAGLGAAPASPKRIGPECAGETSICDRCEGRGWIHLFPGSCRHCEGTGAALVECTVFLRLPQGIGHTQRARVPGWGDLEDDGGSGDLWVDVVPASTAMPSGPWRFEHFGHNWPSPEGRLEDGWLSISNCPLPDPEMRELGFWRHQETGEWVRPAPSDGGAGVLDLIRQRQFFVPHVSS